jgi:deoxyribonuclease V
VILAIDVHYQMDHAFIAGVLFVNWLDNTETKLYFSEYENVEKYISGQFFRRELPCLLKLLKEHHLSPAFIIIDGFVNLGINKKGLGMHLFEALNETTPIIGVAKNAFKGIAENNKIFRGNSTKPLYITSVGIGLEKAKYLMMSMHGKYRIPHLIKRADSECRKMLCTQQKP